MEKLSKYRLLQQILQKCYNRDFLRINKLYHKTNCRFNNRFYNRFYNRFNNKFTILFSGKTK